MLDMAKAGFPCAWGVQEAKEGRKERHVRQGGGGLFQNESTLYPQELSGSTSALTCSYSGHVHAHTQQHTTYNICSVHVHVPVLD